ncbi:PfkB family carbohydrate kinase [Frankia sp. AgKG'84/4]|uniref:PfkB family carbohydrate kinase n=1 Tax=Frankia sp. AgKG'84/4 TaxID=573490 RepID=UPI00200DE41C|nr:PfkB family carbohydrate kinase [Frankia sp. AgKG'84/4]MCL9798087.1 PfkB family carbohydrate kinase [Frankia sp. AgKG'84/4]
MPGSGPTGLFVGLTTLDTIYRVERPPLADEKIVAAEFVTAAGGPATGAAVAFARLGGRAVLLSAVGAGPLAQAARADLAVVGVRSLDLRPGEVVLPVSATMISSPGGQRAVVSAHGALPGPAPGATAAALRAVGGNVGAVDVGAVDVGAVDVVLVDGHQVDAALEVLRAIRGHLPGPAAGGGGAAGGPAVVFDGGSWKPGTDRLLAEVDAAVCGSAFRPPGLGAGAGVPDVLRYLLDQGPSFAAVTDGAAPIRWADTHGGGLVRPPAVHAVDTLGAGDVLHGAFAWSLAGASTLGTAAMVSALTAAARVAARSVESFGTRAWLQEPLDGDRGAQQAQSSSPAGSSTR